MTKEQAIKKIVKANKELEKTCLGIRCWRTYDQDADKLWQDIRAKLTEAQVQCSMAITRIENQSFWK